MSSRPHSSTARWIISSGTPGWVRSPAKATVAPAISAAACSATSPSRSLTRTLPPCSARSSAVARPMPRAEPVTMATLSSRTPMGLLLRTVVSGGRGARRPARRDSQPHAPDRPRVAAVLELGDAGAEVPRRRRAAGRGQAHPDGAGAGEALHAVQASSARAQGERDAARPLRHGSHTGDAEDGAATREDRPVIAVVLGVDAVAVARHEDAGPRLGEAVAARAARETGRPAPPRSHPPAP